MTVTVYTKPACQPCRATKRTLTAAGIPFVEKEIAEHPEILDVAAEHGITAAPVVVVDETGTGVGRSIWGGFRPDLLEALA